MACRVSLEVIHDVSTDANFIGAVAASSGFSIFDQSRSYFISLAVTCAGVIFISELICLIDSRGYVLSAVSGLVVPQRRLNICIIASEDEFFFLIVFGIFVFILFIIAAAIFFRLNV